MEPGLFELRQALLKRGYELNVNPEGASPIFDRTFSRVWYLTLHESFRGQVAGWTVGWEPVLRPPENKLWDREGVLHLYTHGIREPAIKCISMRTLQQSMGERLDVLDAARRLRGDAEVDWVLSGGWSGNQR